MSPKLATNDPSERRIPGAGTWKDLGHQQRDRADMYILHACMHARVQAGMRESKVGFERKNFRVRHNMLTLSVCLSVCLSLSLSPLCQRDIACRHVQSHVARFGGNLKIELTARVAENATEVRRAGELNVRQLGVEFEGSET